jgi:hypothetical protein
MKIEIGESLIYSWLKHIKKCQIVQNNFKVSKGWPKHNETDAKNIFNDLDKIFKAQNLNVFKNNAYDTFINQGECDAVGVSINNGPTVFYAVDVAFHGYTLNYSKGTTEQKVIEKFIRQALTLLVYFDCKDGNVVFTSPKAGQKLTHKILTSLDVVKNYFVSKGYNYTFEFIVNSDFDSEILTPVLDNVDNVEDTSELFIRSIKLYNKLKGSTNSNTSGKKTTTKTTTTKGVSKRTNDELSGMIFSDDINGFKDYLTARGYQTTYASNVNAVASSENITFNELKNDIDTYVFEYDFNGVKNDLGKMANGGWRNSLKMLRDFRDYINNINP